ncbi:hypothetical protein M3Y98_00173900 [Aphelenchoides besseyi]|nr:hypothetical protein M3Y98_00173900 [Aphelenchoides besseyi]KAI6200034.1 hypothetical protein M3Y96_00690700 [Aphelenchoides besseyi]
MPQIPLKRERPNSSLPIFEFDVSAESLVDLSALSPLAMPVQTAWKNVEKSATAMFGQQESQLTLSEADFPLLAKPEVDQYKPKSRRNAGEQLLQKKMAGQGYVIKQMVGDGPRTKTLGKKRRARLLSDNSEDFQLNVPYSLNRKQLWEIKSGAELLRNQHSDQVHLSAADFVAGADLKLKNPRDVLALHQVDENGIINSRPSRSNRGSLLSELNPSTDESEKEMTFRYSLVKAHPMAKCSTGNSFNRNKPMSRSTRRAQMDVSVYSTDDGELNEEEAKFEEADNSDETVRMYRPKERTYSLSDFIQEKTSPVIVQKSRVGRMATDDYVQVEMPEENNETNSDEMAQKIAGNDLPPAGCHQTIKLKASTVGIQSRADWLQQSKSLAERPEIRFQWLNAAYGAFLIDVTGLLTGDAVCSPLCVLTVRYRNKDVEVLINTSAKCTVSMKKLESSVTSTVDDGLDGLVRLVLKNICVCASDNETKQTSDLQLYSLDCNSTQLAALIQPLNDYALLAGKLEFGNEDAGNPSFAPIQPCSDVEIDNELEDDFEHVDMSEFETTSDSQLETAWIDTKLDEQMAAMRTICDECGETEISNIVSLGDCGHSFCRRCLHEQLQPLLSQKSMHILRCPFEKCTSAIAPQLLFSVFPLSWVIHAVHLNANHQATTNGRRLYECPQKCGLGLLDESRLRYSHVYCQNCHIHRCNACQSHPPHWPLTCSQFRKWTGKCAQFDDAEKRVSAQFWTPYTEARQRRLNLSSARSIAKDARKNVGYKFERQFVELRKACLQIVENGFAWLYMTRNANERPANWSNAKIMLNNLLNAINQLENDIVRSGQNVDKTREQIQKVTGQLHKTLTELSSSVGSGAAKVE